jgi:hypothetical protein
MNSLYYSILMQINIKASLRKQQIKVWQYQMYIRLKREDNRYKRI